MARITVEDCVDKFPNRFELVLIASQRARELHSGETPTIDKDNDKNTVIALREIASTTIPIEEMKENLIEEYQNVTIVDEEDENLEIESLMNNKQNEEKNEKQNEEQNEEQNEKQNEEQNEKQNEDPISDPSSHIEEEIKELTSAENKDLEEKFKTSEDLQSSVNTSSSNNDEQESLP